MKYLYLLVKGQLDPSKKQHQFVAHVPELIIKNNVANLLHWMNCDFLCMV